MKWQKLLFSNAIQSGKLERIRTSYLANTMNFSGNNKWQMEQFVLREISGKYSVY